MPVASLAKSRAAASVTSVLPFSYTIYINAGNSQPHHRSYHVNKSDQHPPRDIYKKLVWMFRWFKHCKSSTFAPVLLLFQFVFLVPCVHVTQTHKLLFWLVTLFLSFSLATLAGEFKIELRTLSAGMLKPPERPAKLAKHALKPVTHPPKIQSRAVSKQFQCIGEYAVSKRSIGNV